MTNSRTPLLTVLARQIQNQPEISNIFNNNDIGKLMRLFDAIPCWVETLQLDDWTNQYKVILLKLDLEIITRNKFNNHMDKLQELEKEIVETGCADLFDENGDVRKELMTMMKRDNAFSDIEKYALLCGYLSAINQQLCKNLEQVFLQHEKAVPELINGFNANYKNWVLDGLSHTDKNFDRKKVAEMANIKLADTLLKVKFDGKDVAIGLGIAGGVMLGLTVVGFFIAKALSGNSMKESENNYYSSGMSRK